MNKKLTKNLICLLLCFIMLVSSLSAAFAESIISANDDFGQSDYTTDFAEEIMLNQSKAELALGETVTLRPMLTDGQSAGNAIEWKSSDVTVATVTDGVVKAIAAGTATVTATVFGTNVSASCSITAIDPESAIVFGLEVFEATVYTGNSYGIPVNESGLKWTSSKKSVATVSDGIVTAVAAGTATITISDEKNRSADFIITVKNPPKDNITITDDEKTIRAKQSYYLKAGNCSGTIVWSTSDKSIATVDNGMVYAKKRGTVVITAASLTGKYAKTCLLTVKGLIPVRFTYTAPNSAPLNSEVTVYAITDKYRTAVTFTIYDGDKSITIEADNREEDGNTYVWSAGYVFENPGTHKVVAKAQYDNGEWSSGENAETTAFVTQSESLTECTLEERRVSIDIIDMIASFEGYSGTVYPDTLAGNIPTLGYGKVIWAGDVFYNDITKAEARAYLINDINNGSYSSAVTKLLMNNTIKFNQNQFDALVSFSYNVGSGWTTNSDLSDVLVDMSGEPLDSDIELHIGDTVTISVDSTLNMREGPGTSYTILKVLENGAKLTLEDTKLYNGSWYKVKHSDGTVGYCHKSYMIFDFTNAKTEKSLANVPADSIINEMLQWHRASGNCIAGLLYRRIDELEVFLFNEYTRDGSRNKHGWTLPSCCN